MQTCWSGTFKVYSHLSWLGHRLCVLFALRMARTAAIPAQRALAAPSAPDCRVALPCGTTPWGRSCCGRSTRASTTSVPGESGARSRCAPSGSAGTPRPARRRRSQAGPSSTSWVTRRRTLPASSGGAATMPRASAPTSTTTQPSASAAARTARWRRAPAASARPTPRCCTSATWGAPRWCSTRSREGGASTNPPCRARATRCPPAPTAGWSSLETGGTAPWPWTAVPGQGALSSCTTSGPLGHQGPQHAKYLISRPTCLSVPFRPQRATCWAPVRPCASSRGSRRPLGGPTRRGQWNLCPSRRSAPWITVCKWRASLLGCPCRGPLSSAAAAC
mmetsp:Transcript_98886/g.313918  ORF Transcript_98886/g.313918 Transcript_98886/m.313918 type:complete len:334 (+) Transcript_98886:492-1493(+)